MQHKNRFQKFHNCVYSNLEIGTFWLPIVLGANTMDPTEGAWPSKLTGSDTTGSNCAFSNVWLTIFSSNSGHEHADKICSRFFEKSNFSLLLISSYWAGFIVQKWPCFVPLFLAVLSVLIKSFFLWHKACLIEFCQVFWEHS